MKLIIAIVNSDDSSSVQAALTEEGYFVTKLSTTGGFLKKGNTTFFIGTNDDKVEHAVGIIKENSNFSPAASFCIAYRGDADGTSAGSMLHMKVLLPGSKSATDVTFFFIHIQNLTRLSRQCRIDLDQPVCHIFMFGCH